MTDQLQFSSVFMKDRKYTLARQNYNEMVMVEKWARASDGPAKTELAQHRERGRPWKDTNANAVHKLLTYWL